MSSTLNEALRFRALGQARHIERGYNVAIDEFTDALKLHDVPFNIRMGILDNRAAAWEMIGTPASLDLALEDARVMTQLSGDQAAGCLRAGEIFQLRGQDESALEIYAYGIKHVKPGGPGFEVWIDPCNTSEGKMWFFWGRALKTVNRAGYNIGAESDVQGGSKQGCVERGTAYYWRARSTSPSAS